MARLEAWLADHWVAAAGFMAGALLALVPLLGSAFALPLVLIFLCSPAYMVHQVEEHTGDRFRRFFNQRLFGGRDALTVADVLVVNLPLVWGLNLATLYAALLWGDGFGLAAPYALIVNALVHIAAAARFRIYNPGLVTAVLLFVPLGAVSIAVIGREPSVGIVSHLVALAIAVLLHVAIVAWVLFRLRRTPA
ncbi:MAG: HXXEE domain-containing protein [Bauldia sp.]